MKKALLLTCTLALFIVSQSYSQTKEGTYLNVDFLKVGSENMAAFEEMASTKWKEIIHTEIGGDKITGFYLYKVIYPGGQLSDYNYVLVRSYPNITSIVDVHKHLKAQMANRNDNLMKLSAGLATHQYSQLWKTEAGIFDATTKNPSQYMVLNYMKVTPGRELEYLALENDIARPLHIERLKQGIMYSWRTFSLIIPSGAKIGYNFTTADFYNNVENIQFEFTNDVMKNAMPHANVTETLNAINSTREIQSSELLQLLLSIE
jgi:hypothetical protein